MDMIAKVCRALETIFEECAVAAAEASQVIQRKRKFTPVSLAKAFVLALFANPRASDEKIAGMATKCGVPLSPQAVEQRYSTRLVAFFEELFRGAAQIVIGSDEALAPVLDKFTEVIALDSSVVNLPDSMEETFAGCGGSYNSGKAAVKFQTQFDLRSGALTRVQIESGREPDGATSLQQETCTPGSLRITDLGYFNLAVFQQIHDDGGYFLSRIQHQTKGYINGERVDNIVAWLNQQNRTLVEIEIELGVEQKLRCRLIAWKVPAEIAEQRRRRLRQASRKQGRTPSQASLAACDWVFLVTNADMLSVKEVIVLYRSRWQVELLFKRWKSLLLIDMLDGRDDTRKMVRFWARMCAALIQHWLTVMSTGWSIASKVSFSKAAKLAQEYGREIATALQKGEAALAIVLNDLITEAAQTCKTNKRTNLSWYQLLENPEKLDYGF